MGWREFNDVRLLRIVKNVGSVHQGIILMINLAHVSNVMKANVVQETLTIPLI